MGAACDRGALIMRTFFKDRDDMLEYLYQYFDHRGLSLTLMDVLTVNYIDIEYDY